MPACFGVVESRPITHPLMTKIIEITLRSHLFSYQTGKEMPYSIDSKKVKPIQEESKDDLNANCNGISREADFILRSMMKL